MAKLAHHVFFTLHDPSEENVNHLLAECLKYLDNHEGLVDFGVGVRDKELAREVNGVFDVSLHLVFADRPSHDVYQVSERHQKFIADNKEQWKNVVVYDSTLA